MDKDLADERSDKLFSADEQANKLFSKVEKLNHGPRPNYESKIISHKFIDVPEHGILWLKCDRSMLTWRERSRFAETFRKKFPDILVFFTTPDMDVEMIPLEHIEKLEKKIQEWKEKAIKKNDTIPKEIL